MPARKPSPSGGQNAPCPPAGYQQERFMSRAYYSDSISSFLASDTNTILGILACGNDFPLEPTQRDAWLEEIDILKSVLPPHQGAIYFEYSIPRMGQRIDVVLLIGPAIFVLEFKIGD